MTGSGSSRRSFFKLLAAAPLLSQITVRDLYAATKGKVGKQNVYSRLGVKTVINCRGTWTYLSGSLEFPEVRQAQLEASEYFVDMLEHSLRRTGVLDGSINRLQTAFENRHEVGALGLKHHNKVLLVIDTSAKPIAHVTY